MTALPQVFEQFVVSDKEKPKLLFMDDRTKRLMYALQELSVSYDVTITACIPETLRFLSKYEWNEVWLDHDMNGHDFQDPDERNCGMEVIRYLEKTSWPSDRRKPLFRIHSSNLTAANEMIVRLKRIGFEAYYNPISANRDYMQYDEKGLPK